jgi:hypothetical protein
MDHSVQEKVVVPADELESLFFSSASVSPKKKMRAGFNYNKLYAVLWMAASALVSIAAIAWVITE